MKHTILDKLFTNVLSICVIVGLIRLAIEWLNLGGLR